MRTDLLALSADDLVLLANRGLVKRAQQELQAGELRVELEEDADTVTARWSDNVTCVLPAGKPASAGRCTCPATTLCRHILRSVLAYQQHAATQQGEATDRVASPWNPGTISDEALAKHVSRNARSWARHAFESGQVIELVRSTKPSAYMHSLACQVRFLVPNDLHYTYCDCAEAAPCRHVPLAVWAFRLLREEQLGGVVETAPSANAVSIPLLQDVEYGLRELVATGVSGAPPILIERLRRLETRVRAEELVWPADVLADLTHQHAAYASHDARFSPPLLAALLGEICVRMDAIRANTGAVPQLFVRGSATDRETTLGTTRLIGLGCGVRMHRGGVELAAYMQDTDTGTLMVVRRDATNPADETQALPPFWQLAQAPAAKGASIAALGAGQALVTGGKRLPNGAYLATRARLSLNPQAYAWESLRAPVLAEDFTEVMARIVAQPSAPLRPRRLTDSLYVCAVAQVEQARFDSREQVVRAVLLDNAGERAMLVHPYTARGQSGVEALLTALTNQPGNIRFVAGHVRLSAHGPVIAPTAVVFQDGTTRYSVLPWVAREQTTVSVVARQRENSTPVQHDILADYWAQIEEAIGDLLVVGVQRADEQQARRWRELARLGGALGFGRVLLPVERLAQALEEKASTIRWEAAPAIASLLDLVCLAVLAGDALSAA